MGASTSKPEIPKAAAAVEAKPETEPVSDDTNSSSKSEKSDGGGGCPMKRSDGSYSYDWRAMFQRHPHGSKGSKPLSSENIQQNQDGSLAAKQETAGQSKSGQGGCPVKHQEYNVYSQPIDATNNMPKVANQLPAPGQSEELSTSRVKSSITKGGTEQGTTWTYPSPQMFYNALARKGKLGDTKEEDMESIVAIHNNMNEKTWARVVEWERVLDPDSTPKLLKFMGRPADLSPKATIKHYLFGHPLPYDRHDWTILRSDGTTVRYVIDYYHDETRANESPESALPSLKDHKATPSLLVDVRPAVDSPIVAWNRVVTMPYAQNIAKTTDLQVMPLSPSSEMKSQVNESLDVWAQIKANASQKKEMENLKLSISKEDATALAKSFAQILKDCQEASAKLQSSQSEEEHQRASLDLTICMSKIACPLQHKTLVKALGGDDENTIEAALDRVSACVAASTSKRSAAKEKFPELFSSDS
ncbi:type heme lyase [Seminavis robusta]|uniref:Holocytochrome c-type synthase n=1 Tax=Seminavis robusta TaxID=568900 RepID=A0A9N8EHJ2_9STRA|nr:type heme lyase [Seminavis robusta]|eukprot:Sro1012_g231280.1 type heme lyase (474) ;mRNA; r:37876-39470